MKTMHIGLLLPTSSIVPMGKQFERGLKEGLSEKNFDTSIEITKEFIGQGGVKQTEVAITKLFDYDDVDLVTGILSNKLAENFSPKFKSNQKPFLINNVGENIPVVEQLNPYVFTNSVGLWQHAWSLGFWGVKTFGKKGMYLSSVYDAGYSFSQMFHEGMKAADPACEWSFSITPMPTAGQLSDVNVLFPFLEQYQPDFVFATFCGTETTLFINEFIARGWHKRTKLLGLPFLLEPFEPVNDDITIYTTLPSTANPKIKVSDIFYHLGYQTSDIIYNATLAGPDQILTKLREANNIVQVAGSYFLKHTERQRDNIVIIKSEIAHGTKNMKTTVMDQVETFPLDQLSQVASGTLIGWNNPYLCV